MAEALKAIANLLNNLHDLVLKVLKAWGVELSDKDLHFWITGIIGIVLFWVVDIIFKYLARWSISIISFTYTLTLLVVLVISVEIQQKVTGRGNMEFADIVAGLWGFLQMFAIYLLVRTGVCLIKRLSGKVNKKNK